MPSVKLLASDTSDIPASKAIAFYVLLVWWRLVVKMIPPIYDCAQVLSYSQIAIYDSEPLPGADGLSYKLTTALESRFLKQLPWTEMPQTFKDAMVFTRN